MRQVVLDTETTGLSPTQGHRVIEIGCVELINRRLTGQSYHIYLQPDREVEPGAMRVHGITNEFLKGKPRFKEIYGEFKAFIENAELIIHNAPFDVGFLASEFARVKDDWQDFDDYFKVIDTLVMARQKHPGQKNNLDALCKRYGVDNQHRDKHGALLDAEILAKVYLAMTGGQETLSLDEPTIDNTAQIEEFAFERTVETIAVPLILATETEKTAHEQFLDFIEKKLGKPPLFREG
jgi:DNA polymerase III subunit epsilon